MYLPRGQMKTQISSPLIQKNQSEVMGGQPAVGDSGKIVVSSGQTEQGPLPKVAKLLPLLFVGTPGQVSEETNHVPKKQQKALISMGHECPRELCDIEVSFRTQSSEIIQGHCSKPVVIASNLVGQPTVPLECTRIEGSDVIPMNVSYRYYQSIKR
ncbi:hypothetical protein E5288_WYG014445 [Bos mutus]|uniref:Uncharacterized protein n=1 Tax=Bos mutus TaxID=72004 RepID=A0A6B0R4Z8_9CETA|nr:hypothetical protein [Bos mutus]